MTEEVEEEALKAMGDMIKSDMNDLLPNEMERSFYLIRFEFHFCKGPRIDCRPYLEFPAIISI